MALAITPGRLRQHYTTPSFFSLRTGGGVLFFGSLLLFIAVGISFVGLGEFKRQLVRSIVANDEERKALHENRSPGLEKTILATVNRSNVLADILASHREGRRALELLQERVQPGIAISNLTVDYGVGTIAILLRAPNFTEIARQIVAFENDVLVQSVSVATISRSIEAGATEASVTLTLTEDAFLSDTSGVL